MSAWIRFRFESGDSTVINGEDVFFVFKAEERQIEVYPTHTVQGQDMAGSPLCVYPCEYPDQVAAAEEMIFEAVTKEQPLTLTLEYLDEQADYMNHVTGLRMVLQLLHQGSMRIPMEDGLTDAEMFDEDDSTQRSEISQFEEMLHTYLDVPGDSLRRVIWEKTQDAPFRLSRDHDECPDHGYHLFWIVETRPDRNYSVRQKYDDLAKSLMDKEGLTWQDRAVS